MLEIFLVYLHYALLLIFGIVLSFCFAGITLDKNSITKISLVFLFSAVSQIIFLITLGEDFVWKIYPLITHLPLIFVLTYFYKERLVTVIASIATTYMLCQPAKWFGVFFFALSESVIIETIIRIVILVSILFAGIYYFSSTISTIFHKETRNFLVFSIVPIIYYLFDYTTGVYSQSWGTFAESVNEFLPFMLSLVYLIFCFFYYKEYEQKLESNQNERIMKIIINEMNKEIELIKNTEKEIRIMKHDMRWLLNNIKTCLDNGDMQSANKFISSYTAQIDTATIQHFCTNSTIDYVLRGFASKCIANDIDFQHQVELDSLGIDEIMFSTILSNALENAFNAQLNLPKEKRKVSLMLKKRNNKILLSIKNPYDIEPIFLNEMPISKDIGHGYGTQSIVYLTNKLQGNYQFTTEDGYFILRIVI